jgi:PAS domain S-box-containing protein
MVAEVRANRNQLNGAVADREFRKLAETLPILCWIADADGYIFWYNRRWYDYTGTTPAQMQGWGWQSVHSVKDLPRVLEVWKAAISSAKPFEMVFPIRGADGVFRPFLTRINPAFDETGAVTNWYGVNMDISRQVEAEEAFAQSEAKFRVLTDTMPQLVWSATADGQLDFLNARWYDYTGVPVGGADGDRWLDALHPDDQPRAWAAWQAALISGEPFEFEYRLRRRDGAYRWHLGRLLADHGAAGAITRWYGTATDIQDIVQARAILQSSRDELEAQVAARTGERNLLSKLVEMTDVMIMAIDLDFNILAINPASAAEMQAAYGMTARAGDNLLTLLDGQPAQRDEAEAAWRRAFAGEEEPIIQTRGNPQHKRASYEIKFRTLRDHAGQVIGAFQFVTDVTARLRDQAMLAAAREALVQSQKLESMGQLTGGVAHDFNNLLTPILGSLDLLQRRGVGNEREQRLIHGALQSAERAKTLVHRLLAFARRQPLQPMSVDIATLLDGLRELFASTLGPQVDVEIDIAPALPPAHADAHQLEMALINLGVNARDAIDGPGQVRIAATQATVVAGQVPELEPGRYIRLSVADTGKGMDEATRVRAVEPFFSTKGVGRGTGLGLSMAHGLASQLGGALTIASAPGAGTEITLWLPESQEDPPADAHAPPAVSAARSGAALLVDDEEYIRVITADMLTDLGFQVHEAACADDALAALDSGLAPDLLITDHLMPGMTGVELAYAVRARHPATKILIVSGFAEVEGIDPALPRLTKPFVQSELAFAMAGLELVSCPRNS